MSKNQFPVPSPEALRSEWDDVFEIASEIPSELIGAHPEFVELGVFEDRDPQSGRELKVQFNQDGDPAAIEVDFLVGAPVLRGGKYYGGTNRRLFLNRRTLQIHYRGEHEGRLLIRNGETVRFGRGMGEKRQRQSLGYLGIIGASIRDSLERHTVDA